MALPLRTAPSDLRWLCAARRPQPRIALTIRIANDGCTVAAPVVTASSLDSTNRPLSSGLTLTISGLNYGGANLTPTSMSPTAALCSTTSWTSLTTVACTAQANGAGGGIAAALMLTVSLQAGTGGPQKFTFDGRCGTMLCRIMADIEYPIVPPQYEPFGLSRVCSPSSIQCGRAVQHRLSPTHPLRISLHLEARLSR